ncbi:prepilin-type cleavage/methylation domain-containing protein (plasmid) [Pseudomonas sp. Leaf58]|nr:prepilin-type cleavage/methylation domain-containing protein [Pseudomonas sp. Leaf58]KQN62170.1 hypothetical protein ASF02_08375 [Pseudomonas sp. Leaf58]
MYDDSMNTDNQHGFSLIELVMVIALMTTLALVTMATFSKAPDDLGAIPQTSGINSAPNEVVTPSRSTTSSF